MGHDVDVGLIARYQDGQHFARLVIMEGLNQGAEAVRAPSRTERPGSRVLWDAGRPAPEGASVPAAAA